MRLFWMSVFLIIIVVIISQKPSKVMSPDEEDEAICRSEVTNKIARMPDGQIAALPGSARDYFVWAMMECVGNKRIRREKFK